MDNPRQSRLEGVLTPDAEAFLAEWGNDCNYVVAHTSGSTGAPKEVHLLKDDMLVSAKATNDFFGIGSGSFLVLPLSPGYIAGKMLLVRAIVAGAVVMVEKPSREPLKEYCGTRMIDLVPIVPAQIDGLLSSPARSMVSNVIVGGAPMSDEDERKLTASGINAYATYGMTETCSHVALRRVGERHYVALPGFRFSVDSRHCLIIESESMSFGRLVTNDVVELVDDTRFVWVGRFDNVIITGALKVFPEDVESRLRPLAQGVEFYVSSRRSSEWGEEVVLVVADRDVTAGCSLMEQCRTILKPHERPKVVVTLPELEHTSNGKLKRKRF